MNANNAPEGPTFICNANNAPEGTTFNWNANNAECTTLTKTSQTTINVKTMQSMHVQGVHACYKFEVSM